MANRGLQANEQEGETLLSFYTSQSAKVGAWCMELPPDNNMEDDGSSVDSEFSVNIWYRNYKDGASKSIMFKVNREEIKASFEDIMGFDTGVIEGWLDQLGLRWSEVAHGEAIDAVLDGFERLLQEVETRGRKSLAMRVEIEVLALYEYEDEVGQFMDYDFFNGERFEFGFEEGFGFGFGFEEGFGFGFEEEGFGFGFEEEDEEVKKANMEVAKVVLSTSGVKFVKVCPSMSYEQVGPCAICLEDFEDGIKKSSDGDQMEEDEVVVVAVLRCSHILHQDCLLAWAAKGHSTCPLCRDDMLSGAHFVGGGHGIA